ncbi:2-amino-4-hydroxy-6-hydroxymethyldihydropteridine diphosphokinase [Pelosinus sp. UFO1]|uniref:2-amino-4-hydroxy-6- hydroxymethyldihydropteridine diphosphokinase n=1 Tax=Pelosinus sp. UFO1 TaxID=484770 RepID=UPI0004D130AC|nr:2-amino-4-hydroxy-6-hydroxymethyldihydropteridine diphosphokinase [Pelosinus sp. UFO1]AIF52140.1 2-amino-4-hydroxy-6-hydroxymethyldihydropteridine pyrophosphokinase [Pelosinus sp. UFO1]
MILLGLGSNLGDREINIKKAIYKLHQHSEISVDNVSSLYETKPVGMLEQPHFLNAVISVQTKLTPYDLLQVCLNTECQLGRIRDRRWGPRTIDIDILIYHNLVIQDEVLQLPHPRLHERCFVLIPMQEVINDMPIHQGLTPRQLLQKLNDSSDVAFYKRLEMEFIQS